MIALFIILFAVFVPVILNLALAFKGSKGNCKDEPDFLIVLGYRVEKDEADEILKLRVSEASKYLKEHKNTFVIPTGGITHVGQLKSEAEVMKELLLEHGIEEERILPEDKAKTTEENFIYAKDIIDSISTENTPKIAFLSSECHLYRASLLAKRCTLNVSTIPAPSPKNKKAVSYIREAVILIYVIAKNIGGNKNGK